MELKIQPSFRQIIFYKAPLFTVSFTPVLVSLT